MVCHPFRNQRTDRVSQARVGSPMMPMTRVSVMGTCCLVHQAREVTSEVAEATCRVSPPSLECPPGWMDARIAGNCRAWGPTDLGVCAVNQRFAADGVLGTPSGVRPKPDPYIRLAPGRQKATWGRHT
jgi:hypothetical protein